MEESVSPGLAGVDARRAAMRVCAHATRDELSAVVTRLDLAATVRDRRLPERGLVMVEARAGGTGRRFNLGEATVVRAEVETPGGVVGTAYHLGRDLQRARLAATIDAAWQTPRRAEVDLALAAVRGRIAADARMAARRTAATRVDFATLARGEDAA